MNREEQFSRNLQLARAELLRLLDSPPETWPPDGATVVYAPHDEPDLTEANLAAMRAIQARHPEEIHEERSPIRQDDAASSRVVSSG